MLFSLIVNPASEMCFYKTPLFCVCRHLSCLYAVMFYSSSVILVAVVLQTEGFGHLEQTCPSLLSDLLATVAMVDDDPNQGARKRTSSSNIGLNLLDGVDLGGRRIRRRQ